MTGTCRCCCGKGSANSISPTRVYPGRTHAIATGRLRLWYAYFRGRGLNRVVSLLDKFDGETLRRRLAEWNCLNSRFNIPMPGLEIRRGETLRQRRSRIQRRRTPGRGVRRRLMFPRLRDTSQMPRPSDLRSMRSPCQPAATELRSPCFCNCSTTRRFVYDDHLACSLDSPAIAERC